MKMRLALFVAIAASCVFVLTLTPKAHAFTGFTSTKNETIPAGQTRDQSLWLGARSIDIGGTVNGDVICGTQTLNISGTVKGDVICGAQTVNISGKVDGSVRVGAQTVNISGSVGRNASIAAQTINIDSRSSIGEDASLAATTIVMNGGVGRDLAIGGADTTLSGTVGRDVQGSVTKLTLTSSAKVKGSIDYTSNTALARASGSAVNGTITRHIPHKKSISFASFLFFRGVIALIAGLLALVTGVILTALFPQAVHKVSKQGMKRPWLALGTGFVAAIVVPVLSALLMVTIIGVPLGILTLLSWLLIVLTSGLFSAYYLGRRIWSGQKHPVLIVLAGGLVLVILSMIPILGFIVVLLATWMGAGMVLLELKSRVPAPNYKVK